MCGRCGRLYTLRAARAIGGEGFAAIHPGVESRLSACQSKVPTCAEVFALAEQGDAMARDIVDRATYVLGAALAGLAHVLDPEMIILGGQISTAGHALLLEPVRKDVGWRA